MDNNYSAANYIYSALRLHVRITEATSEEEATSEATCLCTLLISILHVGDDLKLQSNYL